MLDNNFTVPLTNAGVPCKSCERRGRHCAAHRTPAEAEAAGTPLCGAAAARGPCREPAGFRTNHVGFGNCYRHSGRTPNAGKHAQKLMAKAAAATYGLPRRVDPHTALLEEVHRTAGHVYWLEGQVRALDPEALVWGTRGKSYAAGEALEGMDAALAITSIDEAAAVNVWLSLYQQERRHLIDICKTAIACGIAERQVQLAEAHGRIIAQVLVGVLNELGVAPGEEVVRLALRKHLMLVSGEENS